MSNKICLNMIVKNESKVIERCLKSIYHLVDTWCIVDTGSTDDTQEIIKKVLKDKPGELIENPWINFGYNRNEAIRLGEKWGDWLLLIDADMILEDNGFDKSILDKNLSGYSITQINEGLEYYNPRILNTDSAWECVGVTHEYYAPQKKDKPFQEKINKLRVIDLNDGGSRGDKLPRDVSLLTRGLLDEPGNVRYMFYLGQSYKCMRKFDEAAYWYGRAAKESKWNEESWYADYMVGFCMMMRNDDLSKVSAHLLSNWIRRPTRLEPLFELAMLYKVKEMWEQAYHLLKICVTISKPSDDILFLVTSWYQWQALDEFAIMAAAMKKFDEAAAIYSRLISEKKCPESEKSRIFKNIEGINKLMNNVGRTEEDLHEKLQDWQKKITNKYSCQAELKKDPRMAIIAACKGYGIDIIRPWAESLKSSGFDGDVFVVLYSPTDELVKYFKSFGYHVCVGNKEDGQTHVATQRFKVYTAVLKHEIAKDVDYVLHTDIRDVVFQRNPAEWFKNNITQNDLIYASAEGVTYLHEDWNGDGLQLHFGDKLFNEFSGYETLCSGVFGGRKDAFIDLCDMMYDMAFWSKDPAAFIDQHFYNVLIRKVFNSITKITPADSTFTANLGTLIAIPKNAPSWSSGEKTNRSAFPRKRTGTYEENMLVKLPVMINNKICTPFEDPYYIVHQYDRYQPWKDVILGTQIKDEVRLEEKNITVVTALYDLGRDNWTGGFARSFEKYKEWMKNVLSFNAPMVIFVDPNDVDFIRNCRLSLEAKTKIIPLKFSEFLIERKYGQEIRRVMRSEVFLKNQTVPTHPQIAQPEYNILMHEKIQFVKRAVLENPFNNEHFMWLDAGVYHMNNRHDLLGSSFPLKKKMFVDEYMHFIFIEEPKEDDLNLENFYKGHNVRIIGTSWMGHRDAILRFENEYTKLLEESINKNLMDQDQSFLTITYLRNKEICKIHHGTWQDSLNLWS